MYLLCFPSFQLKSIKLHNLWFEKFVEIIFWFECCKHWTLQVEQQKSYVQYNLSSTATNGTAQNWLLCRNEHYGEVKYTVDSRYLEVEGTLWNISRYPYFGISAVQNWENYQSNNQISQMNM